MDLPPVPEEADVQAQQVSKRSRAVPGVPQEIGFLPAASGEIAELPDLPAEVDSVRYVSQGVKGGPSFS